MTFFPLEAAMRKFCLLGALILVGCGGNDANIPDGSDGAGGTSADANGGNDTGTNKDTGVGDDGSGATGSGATGSPAAGGNDAGIVFAGGRFVSMEGNPPPAWNAPS